jgi:FlaA1/EpsC-like NDP-sugar epimerase
VELREASSIVGSRELGRKLRIGNHDFYAIAERVLGLNRTAKRLLVILVDGMICIFAAVIAFALRLGAWAEIATIPILIYVGAALIFWFPTFQIRGIYRAIFRYAGSRTMIALANATVIFAMPLVAIFMFFPVSGVPRTIPLIHSLLFLAMLCLSRIVWRYLLVDLLGQHRFQGRTSRVLIYGAGTAGRQLATSIQHEPGMQLSGFIDDDDRLHGQRLDGHPVFHSSKLSEVIARAEVTNVLLAMPRLTRAGRKQIVENLEHHSVHVQTLPNVQQMLEGQVSISDLREIQIDDLLGRDPVPPNSLLLGRTIIGKTVLVTGAGGSIGGELCRQILQLGPNALILADISEYALYAIDQELRESAAALDKGAAILPILCDASDAAAVRRLFAQCQPEIVFHAAAYKHVPLVEANPVAGLKNNVLGTLNMAREAELSGVARFILVSTDKAVRPTNVMGASKRVAELVLQGLAARGSATLFAMVRFGNVLGSSGSVVPRFQKQILNGGPVTLTHREVTRYFMTIPEAAQLVIQAGAMAQGGEVYVLDMGNSVKIVDLARSMIRLSGLTIRDEQSPDGDIEIREVGLRPGEKLYEELLIGDNAEPTRHERIMRARESCLAWEEIEPKLGELAALLEAGDVAGAVLLLQALVPEYRAERAADPAKRSA